MRICLFLWRDILPALPVGNSSSPLPLLPLPTISLYPLSYHSFSQTHLDACSIFLLVFLAVGNICVSAVKIPLGRQLHIFACRQAKRHWQSYEHQTETATGRDIDKDRRKHRERHRESSSLPEKGQSIAWLRKCVFCVCFAVHMTFNIVFILHTNAYTIHM
jgi:hypothetical protein